MYYMLIHDLDGGNISYTFFILQHSITFTLNQNGGGTREGEKNAKNNPMLQSAAVINYD